MEQTMERSQGSTQDAPLPSPAAIVSAFIETMEHAGTDAGHRQRLGSAGVTVGLQVTDLADRWILLELEEGRVGAIEGMAGGARIEVTLRARDLHELFAGGLPLPMKILAGEVTYRGPVRRFLRVLAPLTQLRDFYRDAVADPLDVQAGGAA
jgi:hypothetical protein